jgi:hypothetical protein
MRNIKFFRIILGKNNTADSGEGKRIIKPDIIIWGGPTNPLLEHHLGKLIVQTEVIIY